MSGAALLGASRAGRGDHRLQRVPGQVSMAGSNVRYRPVNGTAEGRADLPNPFALQGFRGARCDFAPMSIGSGYR